MIRTRHALDAALRRLIGAGDTALDAAALTMQRRPDGTLPTGVVLPLLSPGSVPSWRIAATRAAAVVAGVVAFGAVVQWPMASSRTWLFAANLTVSAGFAAGSVLLSDEPRHSRTRGALLVASILWSVAWIQVWDYGPLPFIASLVAWVPQMSVRLVTKNGQ